MTFLSFSRKLVELKVIVLYVTSQVSKDKYGLFSLVCRIWRLCGSLNIKGDHRDMKEGRVCFPPMDQSAGQGARCLSQPHSPEMAA